MSSLSKYKEISTEDDRSTSSSLYASLDSIQIQDTSTTAGENKPSSFDFSELIRPSANRTVISYSAHSHTLVQRSSSIDSNSDLKELELHRAVFQNDVVKIKQLLARIRRSRFKNVAALLDIKDKFENTPLHLACMLGRLEIAKMLTEAGATVKIRNIQMWTPLNEAISFGNRELIRVALQKFDKEVKTIVKEAKPKIISALSDIKDFYVEINWDFESWIPFVSRFLPSDTCKLHKKGTKLRLDCTVGDIPTKRDTANKESAASSVGTSISPLSWSRGDLSFIFEVEKVGTKNSIIFMDNAKKTFMVLDKHEEQIEPDLDKEIDLLLSKEMVFIKLNTEKATFTPTQIGWFHKRDKVEHLNDYLCHFFDITNLYIVTKLRVEHLSEEELKKMEEKQLKMKKHLTAGALVGSSDGEKGEASNNKSENDQDVQGLDDFMEDIVYRPSLPPPPENHLSWDEYLDNKNMPCIGRTPKVKESRKEFKAQIAMSEEFPLSVAELDNLLEALTPLAKFRKLKEFIKLQLPPGFPVKIDIPIVPAISAKVCFKNFKKDCAHEDRLFQVPNDYKEEFFE